MIFKQFHLESLGHASYLVGCPRSGKALILDPRRDVEVYFEEARRQGLRIAYAMDSHGHNDYLSGITELRVRQEMEILAPAGGGYAYDHTEVKDGDRISFGDVTVEVMHTPGHTPEHVSLLVCDGELGDEPALLLSGGALLVGDVARPDLLGGEEEARAAAAEYCRTIQEKLLFRLPDHVQVYPTHVAGSLCGGNIGSRLSTTLGYERRTNAILARVSSSEEFVEECIRLDNLPGVPPYWRRMRSQNMAGVAPLGTLPEPPALKPAEFAERMHDAVVLDIRSEEAYGGAHIPRALHVALGSSFSTWAGTIVPESAPILLVLQRPDDLWDATWQLLRIGYDAPVGWLSGGMFGWRSEGFGLEKTKQVTVHELHDELDEFHVLDVRQPAEWMAGHIPGAQFITGAQLPERSEEVPDEQPVAVLCGSGFRSSAAGSFLRHKGHRKIVNVIGGMNAWKNAGYETTAE